VGLYYAEAYAAVDYVARTYGEISLRPLVDHLSEASRDLDDVFWTLFGLTFDEFQEAVRQSLFGKDQYELTVGRLISYWGQNSKVRDEMQAADNLWSEYLFDRAQLPTAMRQERLAAIKDAYQAISEILRVTSAPELVLEAHEALADSILGFVAAMESFSIFEQGQNPEALRLGNQGMVTSRILFEAGQDLLVNVMNEFKVGKSEV
ncbi:hypothetical protein M1O29_02280, partial [Dehalococcoidia bacterium]|nr:hypothetical protein [Dehalococcoidia bacterium]